MSAKTNKLERTVNNPVYNPASLPEKITPSASKPQSVTPPVKPQNTTIKPAPLYGGSYRPAPVTTAAQQRLTVSSNKASSFSSGIRIAQIRAGTEKYEAAEEAKAQIVSAEEKERSVKDISEKKDKLYEIGGFAILAIIGALFAVIFLVVKPLLNKIVTAATGCLSSYESCAKC